MDVDEVRRALSTPPGKCPLCGLALGSGKGRRLCASCAPLAGLSVSQWGWCSGRHKKATTQRGPDGEWRCLRCQARSTRA